MIKAITSLKNYRSVRPGAWLRVAKAKVISATLIFSLLTLSTPGAPKWTLVMAQETATDIRHAYLSTSFAAPEWANSVLAFFIGDRKALKITSIEIQPADATVMQGEMINFAAIARSAEGNVPAVQYLWTFFREGDTERGTRSFLNGGFNASRPGRYVITATGNGLQGQTTVTVYPNEGYWLQKKLQQPESERSGRDRQFIQRLAEQGLLTSRTIFPRDRYSAESEQQRGLVDEQRRDAVREKQDEARQRNPDPVRQSIRDTDTDKNSEGDVAQASPRKGGPRIDEETSVEHPPAAPAVTAMRLMDQLGWDNSNWYEAESPGNQVGNTPGSAPDGGASNGNFRLSSPVLSLGGRGLDINLALTYNSRLWSKSGTTMKYDADDGFPAPGWSIGFGKMIYAGSNGGCMLIGPDGTRRSKGGTNNVTGSGTYYSNYFVGYTTDGSFTDYNCYYSNSTYGSFLNGSARLSNGTTILYSSPTADRKQVFPTKIVDSQGNYITITYVNNAGPKINTITDTLGRTITFNYDGTSSRITSITGPGYNGTTRTFVQIAYSQKTLSYAFASGYTASTPSNSPYLIESIYYPDTDTGYWFGDTDSYSSYGMIAKVQSRRDWLGTSGTQGTVTREEVYNFPMTADNTLTDSPGYTSHSETWDRMDTSAAVTTYDVTTATGTEVIEVTRPDGSKSKQTSVANSSSWDDGLYFQNEILSPSDDVLSKTKIYLAQGSYGSSRPTKIETTDELEQMTKVEFTYGTNYNQVTAQKEFDYGGNLYRETRYTYENNAAYINRHVFSLVKKVEQYDASDNRLSLTEYEYDNNAVVNGTSNHGLVGVTGVVQHEFTSDPYTNETVPVQGACLYWEPQYSDPQCEWEGQEVWVWQTGGYYANCQCYDYEYDYVSAYDDTSIFRGNITKVTTYADADSSPSGAVSYDFTYDITGNQRTATTNCCQEMSFSYSTTTQFSQPDSVTKGSPDPMSAHRITTSATYDFNTGVMKTSTDANSRTTTVAYDAVARPTLVTAPTGGKSTTDYDDANWRPTRTVQLSDNTVVSKTKTEMNGRGQPRISGYFIDATNQNNTAIEYDVMGRRNKVSMPYASSGSAAYWTEYTYDYLSRVTEVEAPDGSTSKTFYNEDPGTVARPDSANPASTHKGQTVKSQDAWGRERWARTDAFGRLVEVVEPNPTGNGTVAATGSLMTSYSYAESDLLVLITQGSQTRSFKYDSVGRLTHQKLAEQTATINDAGVYVGSGGTGAAWSDAFEYDTRSNLTKRTDARGVITEFSYQISSAADPLNRLHGITYNTSGADTTYTINAAPAVSLEYMTSGDKMRVKKVITSGVATEENTYDADGRVTDYTLTFDGRTSYPMVTSYVYDSASRATEIRYPKQYGMTDEPRKLIEPTYDYTSRLSTLRVNSVVQLGSIIYNPRSQATSMRVGEPNSGAYHEFYTYEAQTGLLTDQSVNTFDGESWTSLMWLSYEYNRGSSNGTLNGKTGQLTRTIDNHDRNRDRVYENDALGRLIKAKGGAATGVSGPTANWTQDYSYDRYGNKTGTSVSGITADSNNVPLDGLASVSYDDASNRIDDTDWQYDLSGNLIRGKNESGVWQRFEYDAAGKLVKIKDDSNNVLETYTYGAARSRLKSETSTQRIYYAWDGNSPIVEYSEPTASSTPAYSKSYVYASSRLLSTATRSSATSETILFHHPDRLGTKLMINPSTQAIDRQSTLPFGTALNAESTAYSNKAFTSYDRSSSTGLDYAVNRTYSKGQGRFTQVDPIGVSSTSMLVPQSHNLYAYVLNNPVDFADPSGLCVFKINIRVNPDIRQGLFGNQNVINAAQAEITRIVTAAGHSVTFDVNARADRSYTINVVGGTSSSNALGSTLGIGKYNGYGWVFGGELSALSNGVLGLNDERRGLAVGRVIAHEMITHQLLARDNSTGRNGHTGSGVTRAGFGREVFDPRSNRFNVPQDLIKFLDALCLPTDPLSPPPSTVAGGGGGDPGGGGGIPWRGGYPSWYRSMWDFVNWVNSIPLWSDEPVVGEEGDDETA
ncbi:MAG: RHS repeat-associated core domain-containing protein [Acidobacteria bacterium]|nr:RHS repeat-associated core domain-containing protein [Acidobacteriota bacterium]